MATIFNQGGAYVLASVDIPLHIIGSPTVPTNQLWVGFVNSGTYPPGWIQFPGGTLLLGTTTFDIVFIYQQLTVSAI